jgi:hypothetical protein
MSLVNLVAQDPYVSTLIERSQIALSFFDSLSPKLTIRYEGVLHFGLVEVVLHPHGRPILP